MKVFTKYRHKQIRIVRKASMREVRFEIGKIPSIVWGESSEKVYLFIHGKNGCKESARGFASIAANKGWAVLSIDLPEHGERKREKGLFVPWHIEPELQIVIHWTKQHWKRVSLRADSIGAWFSMLSFADEYLENCLFVSPILDMEQVIHNMMMWGSISEERLMREQTITTPFGETLSWKYLDFVKKHPIKKWSTQTAILYAKEDNITERNTVDMFVAKHQCQLTIAEKGEHWFHTPEQLNILHQWTEPLI